MDRRSYLRKLGAGGIVTLTAGCAQNGGSGGDGGDGGSGDGGSGDGGDNGGSGGDNGGGDDGGDSETPVTAGTAPGFPPFEMREDGELIGFDVDLLESVVAEAPGYTFDGWETFEFSSLIPALGNDQIDVIAAAMTITDERDQTIDFTDPYYSANQSILVREGGDFQPSSLSDLAGHPIGAQTGTTGEAVVNGLIEDGTLSESNYSGYDNYVLSVEDLENGNIDAVIVDEPVGATFEANRDVEVAFVHETGEMYGFGIREGDSDLQSALNEGLAAVQESGRYDELANEYFSG